MYIKQRERDKIAWYIPAIENSLEWQMLVGNDLARCQKTDHE